MAWLRFFSLVLFVTALLSLESGRADQSAWLDRAELPTHGDDGDDLDGVPDAVLPPMATSFARYLTAAVGAAFEVRQVPQTPPSLNRIFRPPISVLA